MKVKAVAKPVDFYVGATDIFAILLPGAVVTWSIWLLFGEMGEVQNKLPKYNAALWAAFILFSYAAGHFIFIISSSIDITFNMFRKHILNQCMNSDKFETEKAALTAITALRRVSLSAERHSAGDFVDEAAEAWARRILHKSGSCSTITEPMNSYQWARAVLRLRAPAALAEVLRHEADSKFFRSMFVVLLFILIMKLGSIRGAEAFPIPSYVLASLSILSYWLYAERRQKSIQAAYQHAITHLTLTGDAGSMEREDTLEQPLRLTNSDVRRQ